MESEKCKRGENRSTAQCQLPLSGTRKTRFKMNLVKEVKKDRDGIIKDIKKCKRRSRNYRSTAVYR
ncbi:hypothetical protein LR48_Vigan330s000100 [Vigna angularis]|uniref:Uncharacterized protein n=1 Tax=Phaseolus angularis TaxID=3914 RepID=A0A0L9T8I9_PHAAN|nr:hypothetical protein LR48_Vigan330s000100 [Vigna angularis]